MISLQSRITTLITNPVGDIELSKDQDILTMVHGFNFETFLFVEGTTSSYTRTTIKLELKWRVSRTNLD